MRDIVKRAIQARPELTAELRRRGMFLPEEEAGIPQEANRQPLGKVQFATLLAEGDMQLAARAVLRGVLDHEELRWLDRLLKFRQPNGKRDELTRIVERAMEGSKRKCRHSL